MLKRMCPSDHGTIKPITGGQFEGTFRTEHESVTKEFHNLQLCVSWIARMESKRQEGTLRHVSLTTMDKKDGSNEVSKFEPENVIYYSLYILVCHFSFVFLGF